MGYHYKESGYAGCDFLIVTKKGMEEGGLPRGIVFLTGMCYAYPEFRNWLNGECERNGYYIFQAKHCDDEKELTHISRNGFVNRFGYFITKEDMFSGNRPDYDIAKGQWFTRKHVSSYEEALKYL